MADQVVVMQKGKVVESGNPDAVFFQPQHPYTQKLVAALPTSAKPATQGLGKEEPVFLQVKNLRKEYRISGGGFFNRSETRVPAVADISFTLRRGEILGLVGESGSGKSTLGRTIVRLVEPDAGQVIIAGRDISAMSAEQLRLARRDFQIIFQDPYASLNPRMTVFDCLAEPLLVHKLATGDQVLQAVNELMDDVGLDRTMIRKYPHEFSGGQRQRIAIARALAMRPKLIIADEPVSALDVTIQSQILKLLLQLTQKYQMVEGTLTSADGTKTPVKGRLRGDLFTVTAGTQEYEGRVIGDRIEGAEKGAANAEKIVATRVR